MEGLRLAWAAAPRERTARRAVAWGLLRDLLGEVGHPGAPLSHPCPHCGGAHGPVRVGGAVPWQAAVAYARDLAIAAITPHAPHAPPRAARAARAAREKPSTARETRAGAVSRVGCGFSRPRVEGTGFAIDAEPFDDVVREAAGGAPGGLLRWVRTEAVLKADGRGLRVDPAAVVFVPEDDGGAAWTARLADTGVRFRGGEPAGADAPPGVLVSVAWACPAAEAAPGHPTTR